MIHSKSDGIAVRAFELVGTALVGGVVRGDLFDGVDEGYLVEIREFTFVCEYTSLLS